MLLTWLPVHAFGDSKPTHAVAGGDQPRVLNLRVDQSTSTENDRFPLRLSWQIESPLRGTLQKAYQFRVAESIKALRDGISLTFDSGKVASSQSAFLAYSGPTPLENHRYFWQVRVWGTNDRSSEWSEPGLWVTGLANRSAWHAKWIEPKNVVAEKESHPAAMLRSEFFVRGAISSARIYVTSRGLYELHLNGKRVGDQLLTPGWTSYHHRFQYQIYDITEQLQVGPNAVGAILGDGWYRGTIGFKNERNQFGDRVALLMQMDITYADGRTQRIISDGNWKSETGPIRYSDIYNGEIYDARLERVGWDSAGYDDRDWTAVAEAAPPNAEIVASLAPPVRRIDELLPKSIGASPAGASIVDMGQNMVGFVRIRARGKAGTVITLRHGEVLDGNGNLYTENLRAASQKIQYILKGSGEEVFEPHFTFQGFRYVSIQGYPGKISKNDVTGVVIHSDMKLTGSFETSDPLINQLQHNILWGQKGNFVDIPTDCPQRDERLGWTGDAQVFSATAAFNMDVNNFFSKWLRDLALEQSSDGSVPWVVPDVVRTFQTPKDSSGKAKMISAAGAAGWSDAATVIPWNMYLAYGDPSILEAQYQSMSRWVRYEETRAGADYIWDGDFQFGDWLDFFSSARQVNFGVTPEDLIGTAYFARSVDILMRSAAVLKKTDDYIRYGQLLRKIQEAFRSKYISNEGSVASGTQTAYVLALDFDLLPEALRPLAARKLVEDVRARGHLTTGFLGTPRLLNVLSRFGYLEDAYRLLNRKEYPSWLYPVTRGATTIWERWDGIKGDGGFQNSAMNSFNHYAYGAVGEWMYRVVAGIDIDPSAPGYKHSVIQPNPGGGLTHVKSSLLTIYGRLSSEWQIEMGKMALIVEVPPNTTATVTLPRASLAQLLESNNVASRGSGVSHMVQKAEKVEVEIGSGRYVFTYPWN